MSGSVTTMPSGSSAIRAARASAVTSRSYGRGLLCDPRRRGAAPWLWRAGPRLLGSEPHRPGGGVAFGSIGRCASKIDAFRADGVGHSLVLEPGSRIGRPVTARVTGGARRPVDRSCREWPGGCIVRVVHDAGRAPGPVRANGSDAVTSGGSAAVAPRGRTWRTSLRPAARQRRGRDPPPRRAPLLARGTDGEVLASDHRRFSMTDTQRPRVLTVNVDCVECSPYAAPQCRY